MRHEEKVGEKRQGKTSENKYRYMMHLFVGVDRDRGRRK